MSFQIRRRSARPAVPRRAARGSSPATGPAKRCQPGTAAPARRPAGPGRDSWGRGSPRRRRRRPGAASPHRPPRPCAAAAPGRPVRHCLAVDRLHGEAEGGGDLQQVRHAPDVRGPVVSCGVEEGGVEERRVTLLQGQLDMVLGEVRDELRPAPGQIARSEFLRVRQVQRRAGLHGHVAVRHRALEGQHGRQAVDMRRIAGGPVLGEESEVVVAVHTLRGAARVDLVDLRGDLVAGTEPGLGDQRQHVVGVVVGERLGVADGHLVERVPHPVVGAGPGEVVAAGTARRPLLLDDRGEDGARPVHHGEIGERPLEHHDAGPVHEGTHPFALHAPRVGGPQPVAVVEQDVLLHPLGERIVTRIGAPVDQGAEGVEVAVLLPEPGSRPDGGERHRKVLSPCRRLRQSCEPEPLIQ